jgi:hypothetical protein
MAVNTSRSCNAELMYGSTDGTWKKIPPDRSAVEMHEDRERRILSTWHYGYEEAPYLITPMGQRIAPNTQDTSS